MRVSEHEPCVVGHVSRQYIHMYQGSTYTCIKARHDMHMYQGRTYACIKALIMIDQGTHERDQLRGDGDNSKRPQDMHMHQGRTYACIKALIMIDT